MRCHLCHLSYHIAPLVSGHRIWALAGCGAWWFTGCNTSEFVLFSATDHEGLLIPALLTSCLSHYHTYYCWWSLNRCETGTFVHTTVCFSFFVLFFVSPCLVLSVASWGSVSLAVFFFIVRMEISLFLWKILVDLLLSVWHIQEVNEEWWHTHNVMVSLHCWGLTCRPTASF